MDFPVVVNLHGGRGGAGGLGRHSGGSGGHGLGPQLQMNNNQNVSVYMYPVDEDEERMTILKWISPINFFLRQQDVSQIRHENTGDWFINNPDFQHWKSTPGEILWCSGIPGVGKTVLVSKVVDHFVQLRTTDPSLGVAWLYLNYQEGGIQTVQNLLGALWRQLVWKRDIKDAKALHDLHEEKQTSVTLNEVQKLLKSLAKDFGRLYLIVDALDEYLEEQITLLENLIKIKEDVNLLITCRPHITVPNELSATILHIEAHEDDLKLYLDAQLHKHWQLQRLLKDENDLQSEMVPTIIAKAQGMFLMIILHMEILSRATTVQKLRIALEHLPEKLQDGYNRTLEYIKSQQGELPSIALTTLLWVTYAKRPLSALELQTIIAFTEDNTTMPSKDTWVPVETILGACCGLVIQDEYASTIRLVHYTTQHFLESIQPQEFPHVQVQITRLLLDYLMLDRQNNLDTSEQGSETSSESDYLGDKEEEVRSPPALIKYCEHLMVHAVGEPEEALRDKLISLFNGLKPYGDWMHSENPVYPWQYNLWPEEPTAQWISVAGNLILLAQYLVENQPSPWSSELLVASDCGHFKMIQFLLGLQFEKNTGPTINVNYQDQDGTTALSILCEWGPVELVQLLISAQADVNLANMDQITPLHCAVEREETDYVQLLLAAHADINVIDCEGNTPLHKACSEGNKKIVQLLIASGADVHLKAEDLSTPLHQACDYDDRKVVQHLLAAGADPNAQDEVGKTPLHVAAAYCEKIDKPSLLIKAGADLNMCDQLGKTPLFYAAAHGKSDVVQLLITLGADVRKRDEDGNTALYAAVMNYFPNAEAVQILIAAQPDLDLANDVGGRMLFWAVDNGALNIVKALIGAHAKLNLVKEEDGFTALHSASQDGEAPIVQLLLDAGVELDLLDKTGATALHHASTHGHPEVVKLLTAAKAALDLADENGCTPLWHAANKKHEDVVQLLIAAGADVNLADKKSETPLFRACISQHLEIIQLLICAKADLEHVDDNGWTVLHRACIHRHLDVIQSLIAAGANVVDKNESRALDTACWRGNIEIVQLLIATQGDLKLVNYQGSSLHRASCEGHSQLVQLLLTEGADPNHKTAYGQTALHLSCKSRFFQKMEQQAQTVSDLDSTAKEEHAAANSDVETKGEYAVSDLDSETEAEEAVSNLESEAEGEVAASDLDLKIEEVVRILIAADANLDIQDKDRATALHIASHVGHRELVKLLIAAGANVNLVDNDSSTALHHAAKCGFSPWDSTEDLTPSNIHFASECEHLKIIELLIGAEADINMLDKDAATALHHAVRRGHEKAVQRLLAAGANPNIKDKYDCTPLNNAFFSGRIDIMQLLIAAGADVNVSTQEGLTPLHTASLNGNTDVLQLLIAAGANVNPMVENLTPLHIATEEGHIEVVHLLIAAGAEVNVRDQSDGAAPLHLACRLGHVDIVKLLLGANADPDMMVTQGGVTPLHISCMEGHHQVVKLLIAAGATIDQRTQPEGPTPLHHACRIGDVAIVQLLLDAHADPEMGVTEGGIAALHIACLEGHKEVVELLIAAVAEVNKQDKVHGATPLQYACHLGHLEIVQLLLEAGAGPDIADAHGDTPLDEALQADHSEVTELLLSQQT